jgi:hypothetical protein
VRFELHFDVFSRLRFDKQANEFSFRSIGISLMKRRSTIDPITFEFEYCVAQVLMRRAPHAIGRLTECSANPLVEVQVLELTF